jgi:hypothetical protein
MNTSGCFQKTIVGSQAGATESRASVLDCGSPLPLFHRSTGSVKRQRAAAVQNLAESPHRFSIPATVYIKQL